MSRYKDDKVNINIRVPADMKAALEGIAEQTGHTLTDVVIEFLQSGVSDPVGTALRNVLNNDPEIAGMFALLNGNIDLFKRASAKLEPETIKAWEKFMRLLGDQVAREVGKIQKQADVQAEAARTAKN